MYSAGNEDSTPRNLFAKPPQLNEFDVAEPRDGKVALRQIGNNQTGIVVDIDGVQYRADIRHNVWLVWMPTDHADKLLDSPKNLTKSCNCNGGAKKPLFKRASVLDVSLYETGDRPR